MSNHHDIEEAARRRSGFITEQPANASIPTHHSSATSTTAINSTNSAGIVIPPLLSNSEGSGVFKPELPPPSRGLPLTHKQQLDPELRLLHPFLLRIPLQFRFGVTGLLSNVLFMIVYNVAVGRFSHQYHPSSIYSIVYLLFIPLGHAMVSLLVFGWPDRYCSSLMSNFPIGLTAIAIGGALTSYLDSIEFNNRIEEYIRDNWTFSKMPARTPSEQDEFYSSILVLIVTSIWTYVLSVYINAPPATSEKKEL